MTCRYFLACCSCTVQQVEHQVTLLGTAQSSHKDTPQNTSTKSHNCTAKTQVSVFAATTYSAEGEGANSEFDPLKTNVSSYLTENKDGSRYKRNHTT